MENTPYFVMHPSLGITAEVNAPTTEKARTTFLDWLERNEHIARSHRQAYRKNMVAEKLEEAGAVRADITLHYGYRDVPIIMSQPEVHDIPVGMGEPEVHDVPVSIERPRVIEALDLPEEEGKKGPTMPIQKVMLGGFG